MKSEKPKNTTTYIHHYLNDVYTRHEAHQFFTAVEKHNCELGNALQELWQEATAIETTGAEYETLLSEAKLILGAKRSRYFTISIPLKQFQQFAIAASILAFVILGIKGIQHFISAVDPVNYTEVTTQHGETKELCLPDGTKVSLNACTSISYPDEFEGEERKVELKGEAFFDVVPNMNQPFVIHTNKFKVKVLGTSFNIKAHDEDEVQAVAVATGKVEVENADATLRLVANEEINYNLRSNDYRKFGEAAESIGIWRTGYFRFVQTPIKDILRELEREYNCKVKIKEGQDFNNLVSGKHPKGNLEDILKLIQLATGINYKYDEVRNEIFLYK